MKDARRLSVILLVVIVIGALPAAIACVLEAIDSNDRTRHLIRSVTIDTATGLSIANYVVDRQVVNVMNDIKADFTDTSLNFDEWSRILKQRTDNEYLYSDILIVEPDGPVLASGRLDSPFSIAGIMRSVGYISDKVVRGEGYGERPYDRYVLPYITGMEKDGEGRYRYALVLLVNSEIYSEAAAAMKVDEHTDICMLDKTGRIVFRYPSPAEHDRRGKGQRIPMEEWHIVRGGGERGNLTTTDENGTAYHSGYIRLVDENDNTYGYILVSVEKDELHGGASLKSSAVLAAIPLLTVLFLMGSAYRIGYVKLVRPLRDALDSRQDIQPLNGCDPDSSMPGSVLDKDRDFVTGAVNRRTGLAHLAKVRAAALRDGSLFSIVIVDIDDFRRVNEAFGNRTGDEVLRRTHRLLSASVRPNDTICRYGGDDFLIILPGASDENAKDLWNRIENRSKATEGDGLPTVVLSRGIASFEPDKAPGEEELIARSLDDMNEFRRAADIASAANTDKNPNTTDDIA